MGGYSVISKHSFRYPCSSTKQGYQMDLLLQILNNVGYLYCHYDMLVTLVNLLKNMDHCKQAMTIYFSIFSCTSPNYIIFIIIWSLFLQTSSMYTYTYIYLFSSVVFHSHGKSVVFIQKSLFIITKLSTCQKLC